MTASTEGPPEPGAADDPRRAVHLGIGAFARAHQLWYTAHAEPSAEPRWRYTAFTGRSPGVARTLNAQNCQYTLLERGPDGDRTERITVLDAAHPGADTANLLRALADPGTGVVTLTVTEAGYRRNAAGGLDTDASDVAADLAELTRVRRGGGTPGPLAATPTRLVAGLAARRAAGAGPLALVSCDNLAGNGSVLRRVVTEAARRVDPGPDGLADWITGSVGFPSTMVDRIVPATSAADIARVAHLTGTADPATVVAEPFSEWVLAGDFPAGRPDWAAAGAEIVPDVAPYEDRKLWLLNGAHCLLAYTGPVAGATTIAEAAADPGCRAGVEALWDCVGEFLRFPPEQIAEYRATLLDRFTNRAIRHRLAQVAGSGSQKLAVRIVPLVHRFLEAGRPVPSPLTDVLGAWVAHLRGTGEPVDDPRADELVPAAAGPAGEAARRVLDLLDPGLGAAGEVADAVASAAVDLHRRASWHQLPRRPPPRR